MKLMCEICLDLRTEDHMNRFHSVNVKKLRTEHTVFYTCKDGMHDGKELDCTSQAQNKLLEISKDLTHWHTDADAAH
mgnify:CR=1 FL=1